MNNVNAMTNILNMIELVETLLTLYSITMYMVGASKLVQYTNLILFYGFITYAVKDRQPKICLVAAQ